MIEAERHPWAAADGLVGRRRRRAADHQRDRDAQSAAGKSGADLYTLSLYIMVGVLIVGFVANLMIRPVHERFHEPMEEGARRFERPEEPVTAETRAMSTSEGS